MILEDQQLQAEKDCINVCSNVLNSLQTILKGNFGSETRTAALRSEMEALNKKYSFFIIISYLFIASINCYLRCAIPQTTVVVMGDTGAGKSSTLNALLGTLSML